MLATTRSELTRLRRKGFLLGWFGVAAVVTVMINTFVVTAASDGTVVPDNAPGGAFPSAEDLAQADGLVAGLGTAATMLGVVTLSFWALAAAGDYSSGLVRLLVQAEPHRARLLGGKVLALALLTAGVTTLATALSVLVAPAVAGGAGLPTEAWSSGAAGTVAGAWVSTFLALLVWGIIGLVLAVLSRSAAVAISAGVAYVLVVEAVVGLAAQDVADRLPGATLTARAAGGTAVTSYGTAIGLGAAYATIGLLVATVVFSRRDITD